MNVISKANFSPILLLKFFETYLIYKLQNTIGDVKSIKVVDMQIFKIVNFLVATFSLSSLPLLVMLSVSVLCFLRFFIIKKFKIPSKIIGTIEYNIPRNTNQYLKKNTPPATVGVHSILFDENLVLLF